MATTNKKYTTRYFSSRQEKQVAKTVGGKTVPNSGATTFKKGDVVSDNILYECKTCMTKKSSFSIKEEWLTKNKEEAFAMGKDAGVLVFNFGPDESNYYILDEKFFKQVIKDYNYCQMMMSDKYEV